MGKISRRIKHIYKIILKDNFVLIDYFSPFDMFKLEARKDGKIITRRVYEEGELVNFKTFNGEFENNIYNHFDLI